MNAFLQDISDSYFCENKEKDTPQIWELTLCVPSSGDGGCWAWSGRGLDRSEHVQVHSSLSYPAALHFTVCLLLEQRWQIDMVAFVAWRGERCGLCELLPLLLTACSSGKC